MYLTVKQAAKELGGISPSLVYALCRENRLEHIRIGLGRGAIRISRESVLEFLEDATVGEKRKIPRAGEHVR